MNNLNALVDFLLQLKNNALKRKIFFLLGIIYDLPPQIYIKMKKINILLLTVILFISFSNLVAQIRKIPAAVTESLKQKYPDAANIEWKDKLTSFQADFKLSGENYQSTFSNTGEWVQTDKSVAKEKLSTVVNDGLTKSKYSKWDISSINQTEYKDGHFEYRILVKKNDISKKYLYFDEQGKLLRDARTI